MTSGGVPWVLLALVLATLARGGTATAQPAGSNVQSRKTTPQESAAVEQRLSDAVRRESGRLPGATGAGGLLPAAGKLEAAIPHLERAQAIDPAHYGNSYDLALALLQTAKLDAAREQVRRMLSAKETGELHNLLGDIEERAGNLVAAAEEYQRAAHMDPTEDDLFDWGNNLVQLRAFEPATEGFSAAVARHPKSARLYVGLGIARYLSRAIRGRRQDLLSRCRPRTDRSLALLPVSRRDVRRRSGARRESHQPSLARFVKAQPRNALAHYHYAMSLWKGQPADAPPADMRQVEAQLRRAVALDPKLAKGFLRARILLSGPEEVPGGRSRSLQHATRLEPGLAQAHYRLAQAYQRTGQNELAVKELESSKQGRLSLIASREIADNGENCSFGKKRPCLKRVRGQPRIGWSASPSGSSHSSQRSCSLRPPSTNTSARGAIAWC